MSLEGKVAIVTGASRGVGRGIALQLAKEGCSVYITARRPEESLSNTYKFLPTLAETAQECRDAGGKCYEYYVDHSDMIAVEKFFDEVAARTCGRLDILINNAYSAVKNCGNSSGKKFFQADPSLWDEVNNVGLRNQYYCSVFGARIMHVRGEGLIVNISSLGGIVYLFNVAYGAGKIAIDRMSKDMALELEDSGITVVSFWPGAVRTELIMNALENDSGNWGNAANQMFLNGESIEYSGKGIVALANDPFLHDKSGCVLISTDLGEHYDFDDIDGRTPVNIRSLKQLLNLRGYFKMGSWVPGWLKVPGWLITLSQNRI